MPLSATIGVPGAQVDSLRAQVAVVDSQQHVVLAPRADERQHVHQALPRVYFQQHGQSERPGQSEQLGQRL
jgi:hypothetical protein